MTTTVSLSPLPLGALRIASVQYILRLGIVCTAGFRYAEQFIYERPYHEEHPLSTIEFSRHEVKAFIDGPEHIILVAVDNYEPDESSKTEAIIPEHNGRVSTVPGGEVVVCLAVWKLEPGSHRVGAFPGPPGKAPELPSYDGADMNRDRAKQVAEVAEAGGTGTLQTYRPWNARLSTLPPGSAVTVVSLRSEGWILRLLTPLTKESSSQAWALVSSSKSASNASLTSTCPATRGTRKV